MQKLEAESGVHWKQTILPFSLTRSALMNKECGKVYEVRGDSEVNINTGRGVFNCENSGCLSYSLDDAVLDDQRRLTSSCEDVKCLPPLYPVLPSRIKRGQVYEVRGKSGVSIYTGTRGGGGLNENNQGGGGSGWGWRRVYYLRLRFVTFVL